MTTGKVKKALLMTGMIMSMALGLKGADYNQTENFGVKKPGDRVGFTVTPPGTVLTGNVTNPGGFMWIGGPATWTGTVMPDSPAQHSGAFDGTYKPNGSGSGESRTYTWHVDTNAVVVKVVTAEAKVFEKDLAHVKVGELVSFTGNATTNPAGHESECSYHWDFGDGNTSDQQNPDHQNSLSAPFTIAS